MKLTILYSNKSSKTGKELREKFKGIASKVIKKRTNKRLRTDVLLRWGSSEEFSRLTSRLELNTLQAVNNTSNNLEMMKTLVSSSIKTPDVLFDLSDSEVMDTYRDDDGGFYVRGSNHEMRYDDALKFGDLYISKPVLNKRREYRVHVFNGEVIAVYEKIPLEEDIRLYKSYNCKFRLVDTTRSRLSVDDLNICISAVNALGLLFGGVDLLSNKSQDVFVTEVNSAPGLNGTNIDRYVNKITEYCTAMGV